MTISLPNRVNQLQKMTPPFLPAMPWSGQFSCMHILLLLLLLLHCSRWNGHADKASITSLSMQSSCCVCCQKITFLPGQRHEHSLPVIGGKTSCLEIKTIIFLECIFDASWISAVDACFCLICPGGGHVSGLLVDNEYH